MLVLCKLFQPTSRLKFNKNTKSVTYLKMSYFFRGVNLFKILRSNRENRPPLASKDTNRPTTIPTPSQNAASVIQRLWRCAHVRAGWISASRPDHSPNFDLFEQTRQICEEKLKPLKARGPKISPYCACQEWLGAGWWASTSFISELSSASGQLLRISGYSAPFLRSGNRAGWKTSF
jgi:hypothetical protein